ncbi:4-(cytidine 5'-diphospho)-2-C-methyl-D-erythritol kinase [Planctomycetota bacterium]
MVDSSAKHSEDAVRVQAPAKVNLFIEILGRRPDGYHDILTVMQAISLYDDVTVTRCDSGIEVTCDSPDAPSGPENIAYQAAESMRGAMGAEGGVRIEIEKRIPVGRGMGGGSSDAAAVIDTMNRLWGEPLGRDRLNEIGAGIGSDVPFFLHGGSAVCRGRGEIVEPIGSALEMWLVVLSPSVSVSTRQVYEGGDFNRRSRECLTRAESGCHTVAEGLRSGDFIAVNGAVYNGFARAVFDLYPEISYAYNAFIGQYGAASLTGTGSGFFWLCKNREEGEALAGRIDGSLGDVYVARALQRGSMGG